MDINMHYTPEDELSHRIIRFQKALIRHEIDGALIIQKADLFYFSGTGQNAHLYVPAQGEPLLMVKKNLKRAVEESMLVNLKRFVFPYLSELEKCKVNSDGQAYIEIIKTNLNDIISRFSKTIFSKYMHFTPTEVRVADFVRDSKSTKEIADLLNLSPSSVKWHRKNIRKKLGLNNKKVNLSTYLNSLEN